MSKFFFQTDDFGGAEYSLGIMTNDGKRMLVTAGAPAGCWPPTEFHVWDGACVDDNGEELDSWKMFRIGNRDIDAVWKEAVAAAYTLAVSLV